MSTSWTQEDLNNIESMIASGMTSARFGDRQYTYASMTDLLRVREIIRRAITPQSQRTHRNKYGVFDSGLE
jgi:hypothetical protein